MPGTVVARFTSSLLQPLVHVKSNSSLQLCMCVSALLAGQGRWLQSLLPWVVEVSKQTSYVPYCTNFLISDPNKSFVLFRNGFFCCYAAIASPAMRGKIGIYQQFIICFFLLNVSDYLQPMSLSASVVWCHVLFSCV